MIRSFLPDGVLSRAAAIIAAHPDDEVLGLGTLLPQLRKLRAVIHVTDGAPRRGSDVASAGVSSWREYAALRRRELQAAMEKAEVRAARLICLGYPDQEASKHMSGLARRLTALFQRLHPAVIFTHSYEGGHPDHDACAAAVRFACLLLSSGNNAPEILEFASYHVSSSGEMETERFLGHSRRVWRRKLSHGQRQNKRELLSSYSSQERILCQFPLQEEPIRIAPKYDFRKPPHRGKLYYENFDWGMTGRRWRKLARHAAISLGIAQRL